MTLADFTNAEMVIPDLRGQDAAAVIQELSQAMHSENRVPDLLPFYQTALNREFLVSTETEAGMAFPHARLAGLKELSFGLGRSSKHLSWGNAPRAVRLVFLIAVPATDATQYLPLISGLARLAKDSRLVDKLLTAQSSSQMMETLRQVNLRTISMCAP